MIFFARRHNGFGTGNKQNDATVALIRSESFREDDADVADAVAMAKAAEARRKARKEQDKRGKKLKTEREAHARAEAARFAEEERLRTEQYLNAQNVDSKAETVSEPADQKAGTPSPKRKLNPVAVKKKIARKISEFNQLPSRGKRGNNNDDNNNNNEDDDHHEALDIANEILKESSSFRTTVRVIPVHCLLPFLVSIVCF